MESANAPATVVTAVAPMRDVAATTRPSIRGSLCKLNSFFLCTKTAPAAEIRHQANCN
jgi:hypothetical protein